MLKRGYLISKNKADCFACEACVQICPKSAISVETDKYGFRYPKVNNEDCVHCGLCHHVCPAENQPVKSKYIEAYGGYIRDRDIRRRSTSGGAFTAIERSFFERKCNEMENRIVYGAVADCLKVKHEGATTLLECQKFCSSKYVQSSMDGIYKRVYSNLNDGMYVIFSGTPCQVAGIKKYLEIRKKEQNNLLLIEVLCAGVATPIFFDKYDDYIGRKYKSNIKEFYWRYKDVKRWDFNCCRYVLENGKARTIDRWFSGYWSLFTQRLLMRPSCENCLFKGEHRVADITLGDMWGVDREYPELYDSNRGTSLILCNTKKGLSLFQEAQQYMNSVKVEFDRLSKYQIPSIHGKSFHPRYREFMEELVEFSYERLCDKWAKKPSVHLLFEKYVRNNKARVRKWKIKRFFYKFFRIKEREGKNAYWKNKF